jgi:ABC-type multidrug transport system fused ATPase/permease subunit
MVYNDVWLSIWAQAEITRDAATPPATYYASILAVLSICFTLLVLAGSALIAIGGVGASKRVHSEVMERVISAPLSWFESGTSGRIVSR